MKTYIQPAIAVEKLKTDRILDGLTVSVNGSYQDPTTPGGGSTIPDAG